MPTFESTGRFDRDKKKLTNVQLNQFKTAVRHMVDDIKNERVFRPGLRIKGIQSKNSIYEMTWANDGRATFTYGEPIKEGETHIIWRRIGTHTVLDDA